MKYKFSAKSAAGVTVNDIVTADNEAVFLTGIKERGLFLINYKVIGEERDILGVGQSEKLSLKQVAIFCRQISAMLSSGVTLVKAIDILYQQSFDKKVKRSVKKLYESVQKGDLLSEGLRKQKRAYPEIMVNMIESGESSGTLDHVMDKLATQFEADLKLRNKLITSMAYPAILSILCLGVVILLVAVVLPTFTDMFDQSGAEIPAMTRMLISFSNSISNFWYIYVFVIVVVVAAIRAIINSESGRRAWDNIKLSIPIFGTITVRLSAVRFCRTFGTLFSSGMPMLSILEIVSRVVGNRVVQDSLVTVREDIRKGVALSQAVSRVPVFPPMIHSMILIGEESGTLETVMESTAKYFDDELENAIQRMVTLIEPVMIVIMAVAVGFVILSIMLPLMSIYQQMGS